jgi:hypothetical protein
MSYEVVDVFEKEFVRAKREAERENWLIVN